MKTRHITTLTPSLLIAAVAMNTPSALAQTTLQELPPLNGFSSSHAWGVSANGNVVVGDSGEEVATRWVNGVASSLGFLPGGSSSVAYACSADGSVIVGYSDNATSSQVPFRWTQATGMTPWPLPAGKTMGIAYAISTDGSIAAGMAGTSTFPPSLVAVRFTTTTATPLPLLPPFPDMSGYGISGDGSIIVGVAFNAVSSGPGRAFRWTQSTGTQPLPELAGTGSAAKAISSDGRVIVGFSMGTGLQAPSVRWRGCGPVPTTVDSLGLVSPATVGFAEAATANGHIIVGASNPGQSNMKALIWREGTGIADLQTTLVSAGANVTNWSLTEATGISATGRAIVGNGVRTAGDRAWLAIFPPAAYANCDGSRIAPVLNANDFQCFLNAVARAFAEDNCPRVASLANCDASTAPPVITANDFQCFINKYAAGAS